MPFNPNLQIPQRYGRTFQTLALNPKVSPYFFMAAATTGVAGDVVKYHSSLEDTVDIAASGVTREEIAGFLLQDVKDLDAGAIKGWRNLNNTIANLGDNVGVLQDNIVAETKRYIGSPAYKAVLGVGAAGQLRVFNSGDNGDPIAVVEAVTSSVPTGTEPQQLASSSGKEFIRIRIYNL